MREPHLAGARVNGWFNLDQSVGRPLPVSVCVTRGRDVHKQTLTILFSSVKVEKGEVDLQAYLAVEHNDA